MRPIVVPWSGLVLFCSGFSCLGCAVVAIHFDAVYLVFVTLSAAFAACSALPIQCFVTKTRLKLSSVGVALAILFSFTTVGRGLLLYARDMSAITLVSWLAPLLLTFALVAYEILIVFALRTITTYDYVQHQTTNDQSKKRRRRRKP